MVEGPEGVVEVSWERTFPAGSARPRIGASAPETATIRALAPGQVKLRLVQRRPWEDDAVAPAAEHAVAVSVS